MDFMKRNYGLILKTFLYQVVMSLFGFMMYGAIRTIPLLSVVGAATIILFFLFIMGSQMYQKAAKNCEFDRAHGTKSSPLAGFLFAFLAFLPAILVSLYGFVFPPYNADGTAAHATPFLLNKTFLQGMYISVVQALFKTTSQGASATVAAENALALNGQAKLFLFTSIPGIITSGVGYLAGYHSFMKDKK